jgi:hypothetical protein
MILYSWAPIRSALRLEAGCHSAHLMSLHSLHWLRADAQDSLYTRDSGSVPLSQPFCYSALMRLGAGGDGFLSVPSSLPPSLLCLYPIPCSACCCASPKRPQQTAAGFRDSRGRLWTLIPCPGSRLDEATAQLAISRACLSPESLRPSQMLPKYNPDRCRSVIASLAAATLGKESDAVVRSPRHSKPSHAASTFPTSNEG